MNTVRRLYFYALSLVSVLVVIWGVVSLLRTVVSRSLIGSGSLLATGLSLVLVGLPIFLLHWLVAQRDAQREVEERSSRIRAVFLYAALAATLGPIVYALLALLNRELLWLMGETNSYRAFAGGDQTRADNLIAIAINAVVLVYFWLVLRDDLRAAGITVDESSASKAASADAEGAEKPAPIPDDNLKDSRRLYRYLWLLTGLTFLVAAVYNLLRYLFKQPWQQNGDVIAILAGGISLLIIGAPLWGYLWLVIQSSLEDPAERRSLLRLVVLYLISLAGVIGVLSTAGSALTLLLRWLFGEQMTISRFFTNNSDQLGGLIPLGIMWWYYARILNREVAGLADQPRRAALRRLYYYILSLLGLAVTFAGMVTLAFMIAKLALAGNGFTSMVRNDLSGGLSALIVGLPLWLVPWRAMQAEGLRRDEIGDRARRSVLRRTYLYLALFALVIAAMVFTGQLLYTLFDALFGSAIARGFGESVLAQTLALLITLALLVYHLRVLQQDGRLAQQSLGGLHAGFPTLILTQDEDEPFGPAVVELLHTAAPRLPVAVSSIARGVPDEAMLAARAILLPVGLALEPPEALRLWLEEYSGHRILVPQPASGWTWLGQSERSTRELAHEAAQAVRQLAEGETVRQTMTSSPWAIAGYVLGGLFGLMLLSFIFSMMLSGLFR